MSKFDEINARVAALQALWPPGAVVAHSSMRSLELMYLTRLVLEKEHRDLNKLPPDEWATPDYIPEPKLHLSKGHIEPRQVDFLTFMRPANNNQDTELIGPHKELFRGIAPKLAAKNYINSHRLDVISIHEDYHNNRKQLIVWYRK